MNTSANPTDSSLLLWLLAATVAMMSFHVAQGWVLLARNGPPGLRGRWPGLLLAGTVLGTGLSAAVLLALSAQGLMFPIGYQILPAAGLWLGGMLLCMLVAAWWAAAQRWWLLMASGLVLAAVAAGLQLGWLWAAGFRPGILWRQEFVAAGCILLSIGLPAGAWLSFSSFSKDSRRRALWLLGSAVLLGLCVAGGQELLIFAAGLPLQQGSIYQNQLPGSVLSLLAGVLLPLVLVVMSIDLLLRRPTRRRRRDGSDQFNPQRRRKRRHRIRTL